jgi:chromosome segregation ATPase
MITFECEHCGATLTGKDDYAGRDGWCRACKRMIIVPFAGKKPSIQQLDTKERYERMHLLLQYAATRADNFKAQARAQQTELEQLRSGAVTPADKASLEKAKKEAATLREQLRRANIDIAQFERVENELRTALAEQEAAVQQADHRAMTESAKRTQVERDCDLLRQERDALRDQTGSVKDEIALRVAAESAVRTLEAQRDAAVERAESAAAECALLRGQVETLVRERSAFAARVEEQEAALVEAARETAELKQRIAILEEQVAAAENKAAQVGSEAAKRQEAEAAHARAEAARAALAERERAARAELAAVRTELAEIAAERDAQQAQREQLAAMLAEAERACAEANEAKVGLEADLDTLRLSAQQLAHQLAAPRELEARLRKEIEEARANAEAARAALDTQEGLIAELRKGQEVVQTEKLGLTQEIAFLRERLARHEADAVDTEALAKQVAARNEEVKRLVASLEAATSERGEALRARRDVESQLTTATAEIATLHAEMERLRDGELERSASGKTAAGAEDRLAAELTHERAQRSAIAQERDRVKAELIEARELLENLQRDLEELMEESSEATLLPGEQGGTMTDFETVEGEVLDFDEVRREPEDRRKDMMSTLMEFLERE